MRSGWPPRCSAAKLADRTPPSEGSTLFRPSSASFSGSERLRVNWAVGRSSSVVDTCSARVGVVFASRMACKRSCSSLLESQAWVSDGAGVSGPKLKLLRKSTIAGVGLRKFAHRDSHSRLSR